MPNMPPLHKLRTITLTGRSPVQIAETDWPEIAAAADDDDDGIYTLKVRQHADGRSIVYAVVERDRERWRGGELLAAGEPVTGAIVRVATDGRIPPGVVRLCVAALPAVRI